MPRKKTAKKIGQILVEAGAITEDNLGEALERQKKNGRPLGKNLVELGYIDEDTITRCLAEQYGMPCISLERYTVGKGLSNVIPEALTERYGVIPIDLIGNILTLGTVDIPTKDTIDKIKSITGLKIQAMLITPSDFSRYIKKSRGAFAGGGKIGKPETGEYVKGPSYKGKERRKSRRFVEEVKITHESKKKYSINRSVNVSQCGILMRSKFPIEVDSHIILKLELPTSHEDVIIIARAVRVDRVEKEDIYLVALNFENIDPHDSQRLDEFIRYLRRKKVK